MTDVHILGITISSWIIIPVVFLVWVTVLLIVKRILFKAIRTFAHKTKTQIDDFFIKAADFPLTLLVFTSGGVIVEKMLPLAANVELTNYFLIGFIVNRW